MSSDEAIRRAADVLRAGGLVAFPTETVYGLGAHALDAAAVRAIYAAKGRPRTSPLIVHVGDVAAARALSSRWPDAAERLAAAFWPGPLTLIVPKAANVPDEVTAGLPTVGLRVPAHAVAQALLRACGLPLAAPSANPFTRLSATRAEDVRRDFAAHGILVLDGGRSAIGIESTVVAVDGERPRLLRLGAVSAAALRRVVPDLDDAPVAAPAAGGHASPGLAARHYSPRTPLVVHRAGPWPVGRVAWVHRGGDPAGPVAHAAALPDTPDGFAAALYATLHDVDALGLDAIVVQAPPQHAPEWAAIRDRLTRAATR